MANLNNDEEVRTKVLNFLNAQEDLYAFIQKNPDRCIQIEQDTELNYSYIGKCGHRYPDYYRIADISLFGDRYQVCGCSKCGGYITFIKYPYKWESSEEIPGVSISLSPSEIYQFLYEKIDNIEYDIDASPGIFRDMEQHAKMLGIELEKRKKDAKD
ncbi:MAG: hypothetical protein LBG80_06785 [Bacteroidales bacterium]|jgi:hypothetical protein|nr:hypothetical protein [Bacteroidales bacterium]